LTVTIDLPPQVELAYRDAAAANGVSIDTLIREAVIAAHPPSSRQDIAPTPRMSGQEIRTWLDELASLSDKIPAMPAETFSREMIYQDRD
jgi:hypothetical protein